MPSCEQHSDQAPGFRHQFGISLVGTSSRQAACVQHACGQLMSRQCQPLHQARCSLGRCSLQPVRQGPSIYSCSVCRRLAAHNSLNVPTPHLADVKGVGVDLLPGHVFELVHSRISVVHLRRAHVHPGRHVWQHLRVTNPHKRARLSGEELRHHDVLSCCQVRSTVARRGQVSAQANLEGSICATAAHQCYSYGSVLQPRTCLPSMPAGMRTLLLPGCCLMGPPPCSYFLQARSCTCGVTEYSSCCRQQVGGRHKGTQLRALTNGGTQPGCQSYPASTSAAFAAAGVSLTPIK